MDSVLNSEQKDQEKMSQHFFNHIFLYPLLICTSRLDGLIELNFTGKSNGPITILMTDFTGHYGHEIVFWCTN